MKKTKYIIFISYTSFLLIFVIGLHSFTALLAETIYGVDARLRLSDFKNSGEFVFIFELSKYIHDLNIYMCLFYILTILALLLTIKKNRVLYFILAHIAFLQLYITIILFLFLKHIGIALFVC